MPKYYFFFPKISLDISYFLDFFDIQLSVQKKMAGFWAFGKKHKPIKHSLSRDTAASASAALWQKPRWCGRPSTNDAGFLGTLEFFLSFYLCCVKYT